MRTWSRKPLKIWIMKGNCTIKIINKLLIKLWRKNSPFRESFFKTDWFLQLIPSNIVWFWRHITKLLSCTNHCTDKQSNIIYFYPHRLSQNISNRLGRKQSTCFWVLHNLSEENKAKWCNLLLQRQRTETFVDRFVTGDEKTQWRSPNESQ